MARKASAARCRGRERARRGVLAQRIVELARAGELAIEGRVWKSGVYALLDAVFRARARYAVVLPMLEQRLQARPGLADHASLRYSDWLADVGACAVDPALAAEAYAREVLNRQRLGGRLKVDIARDAASVLAARGLETARRLRGLSPAAWEALARDDLGRIGGFGGLLARHFRAALGCETPLAPETRCLRLATELAGGSVDPADVAAAIERAARRLGAPAARVDVALHRLAAGGARK